LCSSRLCVCGVQPGCPCPGADEFPLRLFVAIDLCPAVRSGAGRFAARLREEHRLAAGGVKWVDPSLMHLTLKFLGAVDEDGLAALRASLPPAVHSVEPFSLTLRRGGVFRQARQRPRVLFLGVGGRHRGGALLFGAGSERAGSACPAPTPPAFSPFLVFLFLFVFPRFFVICFVFFPLSLSFSLSVSIYV
ncbi:unnamed protein product, partial [Prorocentrum cordatum]